MDKNSPSLALNRQVSHSTHPIFSFIILTFNSSRYLPLLFHSLRFHESLILPFSEFLVHDNGSSDETLTILQQESKTISSDFFIHTSPSNIGTTVPRNTLMRLARGEWIIIIDSDVYFIAPIIKKMKSLYQRHSNIGIVAPQLLFANHRLQLNYDRLPTIQRKCGRIIKLRTIEKTIEHNDHLGSLIDIHYAISAFWLFKREVLLRVGGLDENFWYAPEDVDYCIRIWNEGYRVALAPDCLAIHDAQELSRARLMSKFAIRHIRGLAYLYWKHRFLWSDDFIEKKMRDVGNRTTTDCK